MYRWKCEIVVYVRTLVCINVQVCIHMQINVHSYVPPTNRLQKICNQKGAFKIYMLLAQ